MEMVAIEEFKKSLKIKKITKIFHYLMLICYYLLEHQIQKEHFKGIKFLNQKIFNNINLSVVIGPANKNKKSS